MMNFIIENGGTIAVGLVLAVIVALIIRKIIRDKRSGKNVVCDTNCSECHKSHSYKCH